MSNSKSKSSSASKSANVEQPSTSEPKTTSVEPTTTPESVEPETTGGSPSEVEADPETAAEAPETVEGVQDTPESTGLAQKAVSDGPEGVHGVEPDGKIIREGEDIAIEGEEEGNFVTTSVPHYQERTLRGSKRKTYTLLYPAGFQIAKSTLSKNKKG